MAADETHLFSWLGARPPPASRNTCCVVWSAQEVAEPLQDLKEGMEQLEKNKTLRYVLSTLLAIGNFLNGSNVSHKRLVKLSLEVM